MTRQWQVLQRTVQRPDAQQRWDRAYQSILQWTMESEQVHGSSTNGKEEYHAGSSIRPGVELQTGQAPDD